MITRTTTLAMLELYRNARTFVRRLTSGEELEKAALDYARASGWVPEAEARSERERRQVERIADLEKMLRWIIDDLDRTNGHPNDWLVREIVERGLTVLR